ncbi:MAG: hypothetical protein GEU86_23125 [Actinophytocola sp.]|nr:hypothetical protein [Actinophytocola sp.]
MAFSNYRLRAAVLAAPLAVGLALAGATAAYATNENDPRAFEHVNGDNAKTCADASLGGELIAKVDGEGNPEDDTSNFVISPEENEGGEIDEDQYLTILGVEPGVTVTGIVVKGGNGFNVYVPGEKGLSENPPWEKLYSPLNKGGNIPQISHWYACGEAEDVVETPTSTPATTTPDAPTTTVETTTPQASETSTSAVETTESSTSSSAAPATTSTTEAPAVANASDEGDLATTGFGSGWLVWAGALFVLVGAASFAGMRVLKRN